MTELLETFLRSQGFTFLDVDAGFWMWENQSSNYLLWVSEKSVTLFVGENKELECATKLAIPVLSAFLNNHKP